MKGLKTLLNTIITKLNNTSTAVSKKPEIKKLWQNASPTSSMGQQNITLPDAPSNYDFIIFICRMQAASGDTRSTSVIAKATEGATASIAFGEGTVVGYYRNIGTTSTQLQINTGWRATTGSDVNQNKWIIPYLVYGVKLAGGGTA